MGFSKAAASIMQAAAPAVSDLYSGAANADAGYARGLGNVAQGAVDQSVQGNNAFLSKMGTPQAGLETAAPVGDIAYGLHGYIPATTLQREGAAFGSAAQLAPQNVLNQGQALAGATLTNDKNLVSLQGELGKIAATEPKVYSDLAKQAQDMTYKYSALNSENAYRKASLQLRAQYQQASLQMRAAGLQLQNKKYAFSVQQAIAKGQMPDSALSGKYGYIVDSYGQPILGPNGQKIKVVSGKGGLPGINGKQGSAAQIAAQLGISVNEYFTKMKYAGAATHKAWSNNLDWNSALSYVEQQGVPKPIAVKALRQQGYMPGVRGAPPISPGEGGGNPTGAGVVGMSAGLGRSIGKAVSGIVNPVHRAAAKVILQYANEYLGVPYLWGGTTPRGFDCSGFAQYLYAKAGINIPRTTYTQWQTGQAVAPNQLEPGDLVFFKGSDSVGGLPGHVGVYIGGGKMIDAPHTGANVEVDNVFSFGGYMGARRYH